MNTLSKEEIRAQLLEKNKGIGVYVYDTIDSTNDEAKRQWKESKKAPCLFVSDEQTGGRGRRGRSFYSPKGTGIYMSLLLQPTTGIEDAVHITTATAVIVARHIRAFTGADVGIKWVNDLYLSDKKVCGILTEAVMEPDMTGPPAVVVGIGINLSTEVFPEELAEIAGGLGVKEGTLSQNSLIARITNDLLAFAENMQDCSYMEDYRKMSIVLGREIRYNEGNVLIRARALDIDSEGGLMVELENGSVKVLKTGEITVRLAE